MKLSVRLNLLFFLFLIAMKPIFAGLSGTKIIGSDIGDDYPTIKAAVDALNADGVEGDVKFVIKNGVYSDRLSINNFTGASSSAKVVFEALSDNPEDVLIDINAATASENYQLKFNGCSYVTFRGVKFQTTSTLFSGSVRFAASASNNTIDKCIFSADDAIFTGGDSAIVIANSDAVADLESYNVISNSEINGGTIGVQFIGAGGYEHANYISGNKFLNQTIYASFILGNKNGIFEKNRVIYRGSSHATNFAVDSLYKIRNNRIYCSGSALSGVNISNHDWASLLPVDSLLVVNNMISCRSGSAINAINVKTLLLVHNTLYNESTSNYTLSIDGLDFSVSLNNLIINNANFGAVKLINEGGTVGSDWNGVYTMDGSIGLRDDGFHSNLVDWKRSTNNPDPNSSFGSMSFADYYSDLSLRCGIDANFKLSSAAFRPELKYDINGVERDPDNFWMGAAEFDLGFSHKIGFSGKVTDGTFTIGGGKIEVYADTSSRVMLDYVGEGSIVPDGSFSISDIPYTKEGYWMKIIPEGGFESDYVKAYHDGALRWDDSSPIVSSDSCGIHNEDIFSRKFGDLGLGTYSISGTVSETSGSGKVLGTDPIPGLDVVLDRIPPSKNTVAVTQTDEFGNYVFEGLPEGTYVVTIEYEGLPADTIYKIELGEEITDAAEQDYCVDTLSKIGDCSPPVESVLDIQLSENVYPNPMNDVLNVVGIEGEFDLFIFDISGKMVFSSFSITGNQNIDCSTFSSGTYMLRIDSAESKQFVKLVK